MFRKLTDRISSAANAAGHAISQGTTSLLGGSETEEKVRTLQGMGFDADEARNALNATDGNVERAAELLLVSGPAPSSSSSSAAAPPNTSAGSPSFVDLTIGSDNEDQVMSRIMQESMQAEEERRIREAREASMSATTENAPKKKNKKSTAKTTGNRDPPVMTAAGQAALARAETSNNRYGTKNNVKTKPKPKPAPSTKHPVTTRGAAAVAATTVLTKSNGLSHHPNVKLPGHLKDKTKEEQILRCADRLKAQAKAVDTLHRALTALRSDPANDKYRKIDKTAEGYRKTLDGVPGAEGMLHAMNFRSRGPYELVLDRYMVDDALLYMGISALEWAKDTEEYKEAKRKIVFDREIQTIRMDGNNSEEEAVKRAACMAKCPSEPTNGRGALLQLTIGDEKVQRRFDGDDVLRDVLNWIGGHGSVIPDKILSREWCLVDLNRYPIAPIDCKANIDRTLQYIGCWPSGRFEILPSSDKWKLEGNNGDVLMGSSRGLGSAPTSVLH